MSRSEYAAQQRQPPFFDLGWRPLFWMLAVIAWDILLQRFEIEHNYILWHLPGGLGLALLLRYGSGWALPWFVSSYVIGSWAFGPAHSLHLAEHLFTQDMPLLLAALFFHYISPLDLKLERLRDLNLLFALPTGLGLVAGGLLYLGSLLGGGEAFAERSQAVMTWAVQLGGGVLGITPLALRHLLPLLETPRSDLRNRVQAVKQQAQWQWAVMLALGILINWMTLQPGQDAFDYSFLSVLVVLWATMIYSLDAATVGIGVNMGIMSLLVGRTAMNAGTALPFALQITVLHAVVLLLSGVGLAQRRADRRIAEQQRLLDEIADAMITIDLDRRIVGWNKAAERTFGWTEAEVLGQVISDLMQTEHVASQVAVSEAYRRVDEAGSARFHVRQLRKDGGRVEVDLLLFRRYGPDGQPLGYVGINHDLSERQALQRRYDALLTAVPDLVLRMDREGRCVEINTPVGFHVGFSPQALLGTILDEHLPGLREQDYLAVIRRVLESGNEEMHQFIDPSGRSGRYFEARLMRDGESVVAVVRDITSRRLQEDALRASEYELRRVADEAQRALHELETLDRIHTSLADATQVQDVLDRAVAIITNATPWDLVNIFVIEGDQLLLRAQEGYSTDFDLRLALSSGVIGRCARSGESQLVQDVTQDSDYIASIEGIRSKACAPVRIDEQVFAVLNIESRKAILDESDLHLIERVAAKIETALSRARLIERLASSEQRFRAVVEKSAETLVLLDVDLSISYASPAVERNYGWPANGLVGRSLLDFLSPEDKLDAEATLQRLLKLPGISLPIMGKVHHSNGEWRWVEGYATNLLADAALRAIVVNVTDVTESRKVQEELRFSEESARRLFEAATRQALELMLVDKAQDALAGELELPGLFRRVIQELADLLRFDYAGIYLREGEQLVLQEFLGPPETLRTLPLDQGLIARAYRTGRMVYAPHAEQETDYLPSAYGHIASEVAVPLRDEDSVVGVLNIETKERVIPPDDCRVIESVAKHLSTGITRARLVRAIQSSEARFRAMLEENVDVVLLIDAEWRLRYASPNIRRLLGYDLDEFRQMRLAEVVTPEQLPRILRTFIESRRNPGRSLGPVIVQARHRDGRLFWAEGMITNLLHESAVQALVLNVRDVSARESARQAEREQRLLAEALAETSAALSSTLNPEEVLNRVLENLGRVMSFDSAAVLLLEGEDLRVVRYYVPGKGVAASLPFLNRTYPLLAFGNCQQALQQRAPVIVSDTKDSPIWTFLAGSEWIRSNAVANIAIEDQVVGFLNISSATPGFFEPEDGVTLTTFADQAAVALRNARLYAQAQQNVETLERRVRERTSELEQANQQLTMLDRVKDEFLANVSHELRTPIASLRLYHDLLGLNPARLPEYIERLRRETVRLELLVEDLIDLSRLDQGQVRVQFSRFDLGRLAEQLTRDRGSMAQLQQIELRFRQDGDAAMVQADSRLIERALSALLTNALTYTPPGGRVELQLVQREHDGRAWVGASVLDNGPGIPEEERSRLFERFFRGKIGLDARAAGTGLGLSIVREIADLHEADVEVATHGLDGRGACFTFWLPRADQEP